MRKDEGLLIAVEEWHQRNWLILAGESVTMALRPRSTAYMKNSASIRFDAVSQIVETIVWDSGECEVIVVEKDGENQPTVTAHLVENADDVEALLERVHDELSGAAL